MSRKKPIPNLTNLLDDELDSDKEIDPPEDTSEDESPKQLTKYQQLMKVKLEENQKKDLDENFDELSDPDNKPEPTYYNSQEGKITVKGKDYLHGEKGPDKKIVYAPKLTNTNWSEKYTRLTVKKRIDDTKSIQDPSNIKFEQIPLIFNPIQLQIINAIQHNRLILILVYRGMGKSVSVMEYVKQQICDLGITTTYFSASEDITMDYSTAIREELRTNPRIKHDYGYILDDKHGAAKNKMFFVHQRGNATRDPGLTFGTSGGKTKIGGHPELMIADDPVGEEDAETSNGRKRISRWFWKQVFPMLKPSSKLIVIGTMKHPEDLYSEIINREAGFYVIKIPAIKEWSNHGQMRPVDTPQKGNWSYKRITVKRFDGEEFTQIAGVEGIEGGLVAYDEFNKDLWIEPGRIQYYLNDDPTQGIDKNRMAMQELLIIKNQMGDAFFMCEYQLQPISVESGYLKIDNLWRFEFDKLSESDQNQLNQNTVAFYDQSFGTNNRSDWNVVAIVSKLDCEPYPKYYIRNIFIWKMGGLAKKEEKLSYIKALYPTISILGIDAGQINSQDTHALMDRHPEFNLYPIYASN